MKLPAQSPDSVRRSSVWAGFLVVVSVLCTAVPCVVWAETPDDMEEVVRTSEVATDLVDEGFLLGGDAVAIVPGDYVTRGQMAVFLAQALELDGATTEYFADVDPHDESFGAMGALFERGLLAGVGAGDFSPDDLVSREQAVQWTMECLGYKVAQQQGSSSSFRLSYFELVNGWLGGFRDRPMISEASARAVANACRLGIIDAADGWFYPALPLSWEDMAIILDRAFSGSLAPLTEYPAHVASQTRYPVQTLRSRGPLVWYLERRLRALAYRPGPVDGVFDYRTKDAVMAFQKVERLTRNGLAGNGVLRRLANAETPTPKRKGGGTRIEVDLARQVLFVITDNEVRKIVHVSTGKDGTRIGHFQIFMKFKGWVECVTLTGRMYYPSYVVSRTAIHGYPTVPSYPASHGCIRVPVWMAKDLFYEMPKGTTVDVYYR